MLAEEQSLMVCRICLRVFVSATGCFGTPSGWRGDVARFPFMAMLTTVPDTQQLDQRKIRIACVSHQTCSTDM